MQSRSRPALARGVILAGLIAGAAATRAADLSYGVDLGAGRSDNVARVSADEQSDTIATVGGDLDLEHTSKRLEANVASRLEYRDYLDDTFDSEVIGNLIGRAQLHIVEERFKWVLEDTFGQTTRDQFAAETPANRENVNYLSTGPDFTLSLGTRNELILRGRYEDVHYEDSTLGNDRVRGDLVLQRELSKAAKAGLNVSTDRVRYDDDTLAPDFDRNEAYLSYDVEAARTTLSIQGGVTEIRSDGEGDDGWLGRVSLTRRSSPSLTLGVELGHEFSDAGRAFVDQQQQQPGAVDAVLVQQTAAPFESDYVAANARFSRNRTSMNLRIGRYDEQYEALPLFDRQRLTADFNLQRNLNAALVASLGANYTRQEYESFEREISDLIASLGLRWSVGRATSLSFEYRYLDRSDDVAGGDYRANEFWVRAAWRVGEGVGGGFTAH
jgi:hypothetical protein